MIIIIIIIIIVIVILYMLIPVQQNSFTQLRVLLVLTARDNDRPYRENYSSHSPEGYDVWA
jgi:hypothetical protein